MASKIYYKKVRNISDNLNTHIPDILTFYNISYVLVDRLCIAKEE